MRPEVHGHLRAAAKEQTLGAASSGSGWATLLGTNALPMRDFTWPATKQRVAFG